MTESHKHPTAMSVMECLNEHLSEITDLLKQILDAVKKKDK